MRLRSEWLTLFTVTALAAGALFLHRSGSTEPAAATRPEVTAAGIDFTPVGAIRPLTDAHPLAKGSKPHPKPSGARP